MIGIVEFYEKHWMIKNPDGSMSHPPLLTTEQRVLLEAISEGKVVIFGHLRGGKRFMSVAEDYEKLNQNEGKTN